MKISPHKLSLRAQTLGFKLTLHIGKRRIYKLTEIGGFGPEFSGSYSQVRVWLCGLEYAKVKFGPRTLKEPFEPYSLIAACRIEPSLSQSELGYLWHGCLYGF